MANQLCRQPPTILMAVFPYINPLINRGPSRGREAMRVTGMFHLPCCRCTTHNSRGFAVHNILFNSFIQKSVSNLKKGKILNLLILNYTTSIFPKRFTPRINIFLHLFNRNFLILLYDVFFKEIIENGDLIIVSFRFIVGN